MITLWNTPGYEAVLGWVNPFLGKNIRHLRRDTTVIIIYCLTSHLRLFFSRPFFLKNVGCHSSISKGFKIVTSWPDSSEPCQSPLFCHSTVALLIPAMAIPTVLLGNLLVGNMEMSSVVLLVLGAWFQDGGTTTESYEVTSAWQN